ncbi:hypothetical protein [Mesorhizobium sp. M0118]
MLEYLARQNEMLPQVDGFLLMARDFFRRQKSCSWKAAPIIGGLLP